MIHNKSQAKHHQILKPSYNAILPELGSLSKSKYGKACFFEIFFDFDPYSSYHQCLRNLSCSFFCLFGSFVGRKHVGNFDTTIM